MMPEMPLVHRITVKRPNSTYSALGIEVAAAPTTLYLSVKALISPTSTMESPQQTGIIERQDDLILIASKDDDGNSYKIQAEDLLIDESNDEVWMALGPGLGFQIPTSFATGTPVDNHIEVRVVRADPKGLVL